MATHTATVEWQRQAQKFVDGRYSRAHRWRFDGGAEVPASSSPHVVRVPFSDPAAVDPEEAYVASLSSCHMLWFLGIAAGRGYVVDSYLDRPEGTMERDPAGREWLARLELKPHVVFSGGKVPSGAVLEELHHEAHAQCFLANSVRTAIRTVPSWAYRAGG